MIILFLLKYWMKIRIEHKTLNNNVLPKYHQHLFKIMYFYKKIMLWI